MSDFDYDQYNRLPDGGRICPTCALMKGPGRHKHIYLASSWRNDYQQPLVSVLREWGHQVYDFRNPRPGDHGFHWSSIDRGYLDWDVPSYREALRHPLAQDGFKSDMTALIACDTVVLLLPSGASAHSEAAWHKGRRGVTIVHSPEPCQPELMYKMFNAITSCEDELRSLLDMPIPQLMDLIV